VSQRLVSIWVIGIWEGGILTAIYELLSRWRCVTFLLALAVIN